jgi:VCBS repeat-containing protein
MASKTSFDKTPQAGDDFFSSAATGLTEDSSGVLRLDVMANDKGGNAKKLHSLDDGMNSSDLLARDAVGASGDFSAHGARISIASDGTVAYDSSSWSAAFKAQVQALAPGESLQDSFTYAIQMGNGALSWATVTLQIAGVNDAAVITGTDSGSVTEAAGSNPGTPTASGDLLATDVDNADDAFQAVDTTATASGLGTYAVTANGVWSYTVDNGNAAVDALNDGQQLSDSFTVHSVDGTAHVVTVAIHGATDSTGTDVVLVGTDGPDLLVAGEGNDTLYGHGGMDTMVGGGGSDHFVYSSATEGIDVIVDFATGSGGDVLDLHGMLQGFSGYDGTNAFSGGYLFYLNAPGTGTVVFVDPNGGGDDLFSNPLVFLNGVTLTEADTANYVL